MAVIQLITFAINCNCIYMLVVIYLCRLNTWPYRQNIYYSLFQYTSDSDFPLRLSAEKRAGGRRSFFKGFLSFLIVINQQKKSAATDECYVAVWASPEFILPSLTSTEFILLLTLRQSLPRCRHFDGVYPAADISTEFTPLQTFRLRSMWQRRGSMWQRRGSVWQQAGPRKTAGSAAALRYDEAIGKN